MSATWSNRLGAFWKWDWPTRNCDRSTSASAVFPTTEDCRASSRSGCGARLPRPTTTMTRTTPATSPCSSVPRWQRLKAGIFWQTPWGNARPGWHVECACMAVRYLGQPIDIHTASTDLTFPHGDNEIAIACGLKHKPLAKLWMHCEVVMADGKKVSRAGGNELTLEHLMEQGFDGPTVRYWLLATHYRTVLHYSLRELQRAGQCVARLNEFAARLARFQSGRRGLDVGQALHEVQAAWRDAMDNDLNVPKALGKLFPFVRRDQPASGSRRTGRRPGRANSRLHAPNQRRSQCGGLPAQRAQCPSGETDRGTRESAPNQGFRQRRMRSGKNWSRWASAWRIWVRFAARWTRRMGRWRRPA